MPSVATPVEPVALVAAADAFEELFDATCGCAACAIASGFLKDCECVAATLAGTTAVADAERPLSRSNRAAILSDMSLASLSCIADACGPAPVAVA